MPSKKQLPFRYRGEELAPYFEQLFKLQYNTEKLNQAITDAVKISGMIIQKIMNDIETGKLKKGSYNKRHLIEQELRRILELKECEPLGL